MPLMLRIDSGMMLAALVVANLVVAQPAQAADRTLMKLALTGARNVPIEVWLTRGDTEDGSLVVKLISKGVGPRAQSLTLYTGGGGDDGPGSADFRNLSAKVIALPMVGKAVRVDFSYQVPGTTQEQTETTLVGFAGKTHRLLRVTTRRTREKSKICSEADETSLEPEGDELDGKIVAQHHMTATPALGDDDEPLDLTCVSTKLERKVYRFTGEKFVETDEPAASPQPTPSPQPIVNSGS